MDGVCMVWTVKGAVLTSYGWCMDGVWMVYGWYGVWLVYGWMVCGRCGWMVCGWCMDGAWTSTDDVWMVYGCVDDVWVMCA